MVHAPLHAFANEHRRVSELEFEQIRGDALNPGVYCSTANRLATKRSKSLKIRRNLQKDMLRSWPAGDSRLKRTFHLYVSVFIASLGLGTYIYFIPVFAQTLGASFLDLGFIGSANSISYAIAPILIGYFADRLNRAWLFALSIAINAMATICLVPAKSVGDVVLIRLIGGVGYGLFWPTSEVLVTDLTSANTRVREMGVYGVAWASGFLIGPTIGGAIIQNLGFTVLFLVATALVSLALLPSFFWLIPEYRQSTSAVEGFSGNLSTIHRLLPWYVMTSCYGTIFGVTVAILPGYANSINIVPAMIGSLFTAFGISRILSFSMSERYLRFGEKKALSIVSAVLVVSLGVLAGFPSYLGFLVSMIMIGGCFGVIFPITISLISRHFPQERLGAAVGSYEAMFAVGFTVGPLLGGAIAAVNVSLAFFTTSFFAIAMLILVRIGHTHAGAAIKVAQNAEVE